MKTLALLILSSALASLAIAKHHKSKDGFVSLYNGKDLTGWKTTGNWIPQKDGSLLIQPRPGEKGWQRYDDYLTSVKNTRTSSSRSNTSIPKAETAVYISASATPRIL